jgi:hypothetical protein
VGLLQAHLDENARMVQLLEQTLTSSDLRDMSTSSSNTTSAA